MHRPEQQRKKKPIKRILRRRILSGILIVIPLGLTLFILRFLYDLTAGQLTPIIKSIFAPVPDYVIPAISLTFLVVLTYIIGLAASAVIGKRVIGFIEDLLNRIPLVKTVYGASKQVVQTISLQDDDASFKSVVIVDFPMAGMKSFAFVTGKVCLEDEYDGTLRDHYRVFVPTTPNPTSGYLEFVPVEAAELSGMSVEEALRTIISAGLVMPEAVGPEANSVMLAPEIISEVRQHDVNR